MATRKINSFIQHLMEAPMTTGAGNGSQRTSQRSGDYDKPTGNYLNPKDAFHLGGGVFEPAIIKPGGPLDGGAYQPGAGPGDGSIPPTFSARPVPGYKPGDYVRNPDFQGQPDDIYNEFWRLVTPDPEIPDFTLSPNWYYKKPKDEKPPVKPPPPEEEEERPSPSIPAGPFRGRGGRPRR